MEFPAPVSEATLERFRAYLRLLTRLHLDPRLAAFTHAVMAPGAMDRLTASRLGKLLTSDSIPVTANPSLEVVQIAPLLAKTMRYLCGESVGDRLCRICRKAAESETVQPFPSNPA